MSQYKIIWVDDDINNPELRPDKVSLENRECDILCFDNSDSFLDYIADKDNSCDSKSIDCLIIDLFIPDGKGKQIKKRKTRSKTTGQVILEILNNSKFKNILTIVYTIANNDAKQYCKDNDILYWNKMDYSSDEFADMVIKTIEKNGK